MTKRVSGNGVTIRAVKSIEGLPENTLPSSDTLCGIDGFHPLLRQQVDRRTLR